MLGLTMDFLRGFSVYSLYLVVIGSELSPQSRVFVVTWWLADLRHVLCWLAIPWIVEFIERKKDSGLYSPFGVDNLCNVETIGIGGRTMDKVIKFDLQTIWGTAPNVVIMDIGVRLCPYMYLLCKLFACNACWDLVLSRVAILNKHMLCWMLSWVLPTDSTWWRRFSDPYNAWPRTSTTTGIALATRTQSDSESTSTPRPIWWSERTKPGRMLDSLEPTFWAL